MWHAVKLPVIVVYRVYQRRRRTTVVIWQASAGPQWLMGGKTIDLGNKNQSNGTQSDTSEMAFALCKFLGKNSVWLRAPPTTPKWQSLVGQFARQVNGPLQRTTNYWSGDFIQMQFGLLRADIMIIMQRASARHPRRTSSRVVNKCNKTRLNVPGGYGHQRRKKNPETGFCGMIEI